jgi:hypothetical protein
MITIPPESLQRLGEAIRLERERIDHAMKRILDALASSAVDSVQGYINRAVDRPTSFTRNACGMMRAKLSPGKMFSMFFIKNIQAKYLMNMIEGKTGEKWKPVPTSQTENQFGNLPRNALKGGKTFVLKVPGKRPMVMRVGGGNRAVIAIWTHKRQYQPTLGSWRRVAIDGIDRALDYAIKQAIGKG